MADVPLFSSLAEFVEGLAAHRPERVAIRFGERAWSRGELVAAARMHAAGWHSAGYAPGDVVGIVGETGPPFVHALFSTARAGLVPLLVDPRLTADELGLVFDRARPRALAFCPDTRLAVRSDLPRFDFDDGCAALLMRRADPPATPRAPLSDAGVALMLVTSGTSGGPRVVALSASNLASNIAAAASMRDGARDQEAFLSLLPMTHAFELTLGVMGPLWCGASVVFPESRNPHRLLKIIRAARITHLNVVPAVIQMVAAELRESPSSLLALVPLVGQLRSIACGGAPLSPDLVARLVKCRVPLWVGYGLTEASPSVTAARADSVPPGSVGRALPGVEIRVEGGTGELLVRGRNVMQGYVGDPEATAEAFTDGWLRTGDLARVDEAGNVFILGRRRDTIVTAAGLKLLPEDIEAAYQSPLFAERCAVGLPDEPGGERPHLVVVPSSGANLAELEGEFQRLSFAAGTRQAFGLTVLSSPLPRTRTLKVRRDLVRQAAMEPKEGSHVCR
jgi:acyl-CoA synthetase (AMP-forming)/AMP-acid ligase II